MPSASCSKTRPSVKASAHTSLASLDPRVVGRVPVFLERAGLGHHPVLFQNSDEGSSCVSVVMA